MEASMELMKVYKQEDMVKIMCGNGVWRKLSTEVMSTLKEGG